MTACIAAKIAAGEIVHIDASLIRANVSWEALAVRHVADVEAGNPAEFEWKDRQSGKYKKICTTDPDATMATSSRDRRLEPAYKQHTAVDDLGGVVLDVEVSTGEENEGMAVEARLDAIASTTGVNITTATMDAAGPSSKNCIGLRRDQDRAVLAAKEKNTAGKKLDFFNEPIVHLIRHSLEFVSWKDRKLVVPAQGDLPSQERRTWPEGLGGVRDKLLGSKISGHRPELAAQMSWRQPRFCAGWRQKR